MKILVVNDVADCGESYALPFEDMGEIIRTTTGNSIRLDGIDLIVFCGGSDVSPNFYDSPKSARCGFTDETRDYYETDIFDIGKDIPKVGICRGSQFLCVASGGTLVQDLHGHNSGAHPIKLDDGRVIVVNSLHHQMALPPNDADVLAWAEPCRSQRYYGGSGLLDVEEEVEAAFYPATRSLGVQWHPEIMEPDMDGYKYFMELLELVIK